MRRKMNLKRRFFMPPAGSFFLFGPRGTGKSFWCERAFPEALRLDLLEPDLERELSARPERLRARIEAAPGVTEVVIDEVQRVPELLTVVHALIESRRGLRFVLTGSSARKLRREGVDLLAGRALLCELHPFLAGELGAGFALDRALAEGTLPLVEMADDRAWTLRTYVALYLREEVQQEALVRDLGAFARFLEVVSFSHGQVVNVSSIARDCEISRKTVIGYFAILEDLLLSFRVPVFTRRARRETTVHPKFYFFDAGVFRSLRPAGPLDRLEEIGGAALEGLVAQQLRAWIAYRNAREQLYFWRTRAGSEVDFVVYGESGLAALEVKNSRSVRPEDLRSLRAFGADYPGALRLLLYRGKERAVEDGVLCLPVEQFLLALHPQSGIDSWTTARPATRPAG